GRGEILFLLLQLPGGHEDPLTGPDRSAGRRPADAAVVPILLAVVLLWGGSYPAIKATQPFFPPLAFAAFRCGVAAVVLLAVGLATGALRPGVRRRDWGVVVLLGLLGNTLFHSLLIRGIHHTSPAHAALLVALSPVLATLLARFLHGEPLGRRRLGGIALGFAGVALIVTRGDPRR